MMNKDEISLEEALGNLEQIVSELEAGKMSLEESLVLFEKGMKLVRLCSTRLDSAERTIECLTGELPMDIISNADKA